MRLVVAALVGLTVVAVPTPTPAGAACAVVEDETSPVVFIGVADDVRPDIDRSTSAAVADFRVEQWIRGGDGEVAAVLTNASSTDDGTFTSVADDRPRVNPGDRWEIHARQRPDGRLDSACHTSTFLAAGLPVPFRGPDWAIVGPVLALAAAVVAIAVLVIGQRRRAPRSPVDA